MAVNKLALIRYKTIDDCLRNRYRKWTLEDLIEKVAERLKDTEGIDSGISKRTIQADLQTMRSDKLGYNAPIVVRDKRYYAYEDPQYSITNLPVNDADLEKLKEVLGLLRQFEGFSYFEELGEMIARLDNQLIRSTGQEQDLIQFESNSLLKGLKYLHPLYQAIQKRKVLEIVYSSFKTEKSQQFTCYPYLLKEYRNRWFLIVKARGVKMLLTLALDRIQDFRELEGIGFEEHKGFDPRNYFANVIGVTRTEKDQPEQVVLFINKRQAPYVLTKPIHSSQQLIREEPDGILIKIIVILNLELEREILGFGEDMKVVAPRKLLDRMIHRLEGAIGSYQE